MRPTFTMDRLRATTWSAFLAIPVALLAVGWYRVSAREVEARQEARRRTVAQGAALVSAALREALEELRAREDERPYYHWTYYYTPQDLISVQEGVAVSPLGTVPRDPRVRGHFQLDPGGVLSSPLEHPEAPWPSRIRGRQVLAQVQGALLASLSRRTHAAPSALDVFNTNAVQTQAVYSNEVLADIRAAQSGERAAWSRVQNRSRAPLRQRVDLPWGSAPEHTVTPTGGAEEAHARPGEVARYRPMIFAREGARRYVFRVVETAGAASVQGALLDGEVLQGPWLQGLLARHRTGAVALSVVPRGGGTCELATALPSPLDDLSLCARGLGPAADTSLRWQRLSLLGVLLTLAVAHLARMRAHARERALAAVERSFVASVSHELRTPLATLRLHAEMLAEGWVTDARRPRVLKDLVEQSTRLSRLVEDVLTFGRLAEGRATVKVSTFDLAARVRTVVDNERERLEARGMTLDTAGIPKEPVAVRADPTALEQVLLNLLENAARYGLGEDRTVSVAVEPRGESVVLSVRDRGPGVPEAERERVFDRFYRGAEALRSHVAGTGLGLAIVRGLCRAMDGDAKVVPAEGGGCRVEVRLPAAISAPS